MIPPAIRFDVDAAEAAGEAWGFNCGPAAICAVLELTPDQVRPHLQDFERKHYTNPTLMFAALKSLGVKIRNHPVRERDGEYCWPEFPLGLIRIQWDGPWCAPGVPIGARYRRTHWIASARDMELFGRPCTLAVFDVNATCAGGWIRFEEWSKNLVPWLLRECVPKANGNWWLTHAIEVIR